MLNQPETNQPAGKPRSTPGRTPASLAFTLIEIIGVLAILAIVATAIASATIRRLDITAANLESTNLVSFATALQNSALRTRYIAGPTGTSNWVQMIAGELGLNPYLVSTNSRNCRRVLLRDPNYSIGLPYSQTIAGTGSILPPTARLIILSTLGPAFPASLVDGTTNDFNTIWNTPDGTVPAVSAANPLYPWSGKGGDLIVQRVDLSSLFVHLVLWNYPPQSPPQGWYQIDSPLGQTNINQVPAPPGSVNTYFLRNTILSLLDDRQTNQVDQMLGRDTAFFYIQSVWRGTLDLGQGLGQGSTNILENSKVGSAFGATAAAFLSSPYNTAATAGTTPPIVLNAMSNFMSAYIPYASAGFPGGSLATTVKTLQTELTTQMQNLFDGLPNAGGCSNAPTQ
jgi:type II secretory pathway pseudopilin PulG